MRASSVFTVKNIGDEIASEECIYRREYLRRNCEWKQVEIISDDRRSSDVSRGKPCAYMSY